MPSGNNIPNRNVNATTHNYLENWELGIDFFNIHSTFQTENDQYYNFNSSESGPEGNSMDVNALAEQFQTVGLTVPNATSDTVNGLDQLMLSKIMNMNWLSIKL